MLIKKEYKFYAGHRNQTLKGTKCARPHGHDYKLFCVFNVERNGDITTLFDDFDKEIEPWLKENIDHRMFMDQDDPLKTYFDKYEAIEGEDLGYALLPFPSSVENVCFYLFDQIHTEMEFTLNRIELQETRTSTVIYDTGDYINDLNSELGDKLIQFKNSTRNGSK